MWTVGALTALRMATMLEPSPVQFAAMREWLIDYTAGASKHPVTPHFKDASVTEIERLIESHYPGGVEQFLANHKEQA